MGVAEGWRETCGGAAGVTAGHQVVWRKHMLFCSERERGEQQRRPFHLLPVRGEWRQ